MLRAPSFRMSPLKSQSQIHAELSGLIAEAVAETDFYRRQGLLVLADHWSDILRRRREAEEAMANPPPGPRSARPCS